MSTAPVLSPRALQESVASPEVVRSLLTVPRLLRKNHNNFVSIKVGDEIFLRVHRPVATRFSPVWKRELQNVASTVVTVTFTPDPPAAPVVTQPKPKPEDTPVPSEPIPPPPPPPSNRTALKFIVQWMEQGGADPNGNNAVPYPKGYRAGLEKVLAIATMLQVSELVTRLKRDLGRMPPRRCPTCGAVEHPGFDCETCWFCGEIGHRKADCFQAHQAHLRRVAWQERRAARERQEERDRAWREEEEKRLLEYKIRKGMVAVGDDKFIEL